MKYTSKTGLPLELQRGVLALPYPRITLTLQLQFLLQPEMGELCCGLMGSSPKRPGDDMGFGDAPLRELVCDAADCFSPKFLSLFVAYIRKNRYIFVFYVIWCSKYKVCM